MTGWKVPHNAKQRNSHIPRRCAAHGRHTGVSVIRSFDNSSHGRRNEDALEIQTAKRAGKYSYLFTVGVPSVDEDHRLTTELTESSFGSHAALSQILVSQLNTESGSNVF